MSLKQRIEEDLRTAMKAKNKDEIRALRAIKSLILLSETEKGASGDLSPEAEMGLLTRACKQRRDSAQIYEEKGREDLAAIENAELEVISRYLPKQLTEDELQKELQKIISDLGASGLQDMGRVMGVANKSLKGQAEGGNIARLVRSMLAS